MKPWLYEDFVPGATIGESVLPFQPELLHAWQRIFGVEADGGPAQAASMAVVMMMRAYLNVVTPRPPGNVHARQHMHLRGTLRLGESIRTVVSCEHKEIRRARRYVDLRAVGTGEGGRPLFDARLSLVWAA